MTVADILTLYEYNYWANHRTLESVAQVPPGEYLRDSGSSHGGLHGTLVHIMGAEEIWLRRWKGVSPATFYSPPDFPTYEDLCNRWEMIETEMMGFCRMLKSDEDIRRAVEYKDLKGNPYSQPLWQLMQHLVNHSSYHRGQIATLLRQRGLKPQGTDLVAFYRQQTT